MKVARRKSKPLFVGGRGTVVPIHHWSDVRRLKKDRIALCAGDRISSNERIFEAFASK